MSSSKVHVWMAMDPETRRVTAQTRPFEDRDFSKGALLRNEHVRWPQRDFDVPASSWTRILTATLSPAAVDRAHRRWWDQAGGDGAPCWPRLPDEEG